MSELVDPVVTLELHEVSHRGAKLAQEAGGFSSFLKKYLARLGGEAGVM
jgi:hypothetical protein